MKTIWMGVGIAAQAMGFWPEPGEARTLCCGAKFAMTFADAAPEVQLLVLVFWGVAIAAVALWVRALRRLRGAEPVTPVRTLAFLSAWRTGGPLLALACAGYQMMNNFVGVYAYPPVESYRDNAPGLAEVAMVLWLGFQAGAVAGLVRGDLAGRVGVRR